MPRSLALLVLVLVAVLPRLAIVLAPSASLELAPARSERALYSLMPEEANRGTTAKEVLDGPLLPLLDYQFAPWLGGSLVVSLLAVPGFALLGPNVLALKLVPLAFHALAVVLAFLLLERFVSRRAAWIGGLLLASAPPAYSLITTLCLGNHVEGTALSLALLFVFTSAVHGGGPSPLRGFLFGVLAGFSVWFLVSLAFLPALLVALALAVDHRLWRTPGIWAIAPGFALGLAPWIALSLSGGAAVSLAPYGQTVSEMLAPGLGHALVRLGEIVAVDLPRSFVYDALGGERAHALELVHWIPLALAALGGVHVVRRTLAGLPRAVLRGGDLRAALHPAVVATLALALLVLLLAATSWEPTPGIVLEQRYLAVLYPFLVLLAATGLDALAEVGRRARLAALGSTAALIALATAGTLAFVDLGRFGSEAFEPAWSTRVLGRFVALSKHRDEQALCAFVRRAREERSAEVSEELCFTIGRTLKDVLLDARRREQAGEPTPLAPTAIAEALAALRECAQVELRPYFEEPWPGERPCSWKERDMFWRQWKRREADPLRPTAPR